jgi:hypothetical protein
MKYAVGSRRRGLSRILVETLIILLVLASTVTAYFVYARYSRPDSVNTISGEAFIVGDKLVLNLKNVGSKQIQSTVLVSIYDKHGNSILKEPLSTEVSIDFGKSSSVTIQLPSDKLNRPLAPGELYNVFVKILNLDSGSNKVVPVRAYCLSFGGGEGVAGVETVGVTDVSSTSATLIGRITGTETMTVRGFEWGTESGSYTDSWTEEGTFSPGTFSHQITGLDEGKTYYFRAKAYKPTLGWIYGDELSFSTSTNPINLKSSSGEVYAPYGERSAFIAAGRIWVFWEDPEYPSLYHYYASSAPLSDLSQWTTNNIVSYLDTFEHGDVISIWFDGQYFHFLGVPSYNTQVIYYVRATPNSDGSLSFGDTAYISLIEIGTAYDVCNSGAVAVDGQGKVWVAITVKYYEDEENGISKWKHLLLWHDENDGDFTIDGYYILGGYTLDDPYEDCIAVSGQFIVLSDGELHYLYVPYALDGRTLNCSSYLYDARKTDTGWSKETVYSNTVQPAFSATTDGSNIHVTFLDTDNHIHYMIRSASNHQWGGHQLIYSSNPVFSLTLTMLGNKVYCIWVDNGNSIKCLYRDSSWSEQPQTLVSELSCDTPSLVNRYYVLTPSSNTNILSLFWIGDCSEGSGTTFYFQAFQMQQ